MCATVVTCAGQDTHGAFALYTSGAVAALATLNRLTWFGQRDAAVPFVHSILKNISAAVRTASVVPSLELAREVGSKEMSHTSKSSPAMASFIFFVLLQTKTQTFRFSTCTISTCLLAIGLVLLKHEVEIISRSILKKRSMSFFFDAVTIVITLNNLQCCGGPCIVMFPCSSQCLAKFAIG